MTKLTSIFSSDVIGIFCPLIYTDTAGTGLGFYELFPNVLSIYPDRISYYCINTASVIPICSPLSSLRYDLSFCFLRQLRGKRISVV